MDLKIIAGVAPGGLKDDYVVRVFICFIYHTLDVPLSREDILAIFSVDEQVDYFTLVTAFSSLVSSEHLLPGEGEKYVLSQRGHDTATNLYTAVPSSLRGHVLRRGYEYLERQRKDNEVSTSIEKKGRGFQVTCSIHEGDLEFLGLSFFAPNEHEAEKIARRFYEGADDIYSTLLEKLVR